MTSPGRIVWKERNGTIYGKFEDDGGRCSHLTLSITYDRGRPDMLRFFDSTSGRGWQAIGHVQGWEKDNPNYFDHKKPEDGIAMLKETADLLYLNKPIE